MPYSTGHSRPKCVSSWRLFLGFLLLYVAFAGGHLYTADDWSRFYAARGFLTELRPVVPDKPHVYGVSGRDGLRVSHFSPGLSLVSLPLLFCGHLAGTITPQHQELIERIGVSFLNQIVMAGLLVLLFRLMRRAGVAPKHSLLLTLLAAVGSLAFPYAKHFWAEPLQTALLLGALLTLERLDGGFGKPFRYAFFSAHLSLAFAVKYESVIPIAILGTYMMIRHFPRGANRTIAFAVPWLFVAVLCGGYNLWRFGSILDFGYHGLIVSSTTAGTEFSLAAAVPAPDRVVRRLALLLFSPGQGLCVFVPTTVLAIIYSLKGRAPTILRLSYGCAFGLLGFYALLDRSSTWCWGPRYLFPSMILWWPALGFIRGRAAKTILPVLGTVALCFALLGVLINFHDGIEEIRAERGFTGWEWVQGVQNDPALSPLWWHAKLLPLYIGRTFHPVETKEEHGESPVFWRHRRLDILWLALWVGGWSPAILLVPVVAIGMALRQLRLAWHEAEQLT